MIEKGAEIIASVIRGPAIIGSGSRIERSYIGPFTSVQDNVHVRASEVEHSIILSESVILELGSRMEGSLVGHNVADRTFPIEARSTPFHVGRQ